MSEADGRSIVGQESKWVEIVPSAKLLPGDAEGELCSDALFGRTAILHGWAAGGPSRQLQSLIQHTGS